MTTVTTESKEKAATIIFKLRQKVKDLEERLSRAESVARAAREAFDQEAAPWQREIDKLRAELILAENRRKDAQDDATAALSEMERTEKTIRAACGALIAAGVTADPDKCRMEPKLLAESIAALAGKISGPKPSGVV